MSSHYHQIMCAAVAAVSAWNVLVIVRSINLCKIISRLKKTKSTSTNQRSLFYLLPCLSIFHYLQHTRIQSFNK